VTSLPDNESLATILGLSLVLSGADLATLATDPRVQALTDSQRAMIAATVASHHDGQRAATGPRIHRAPDAPPTQTEAAAMLGVSTRQIRRARQVINHGTEELKTLVADGLVVVATAARVAVTLAPLAQTLFVAQVRSGIDPRVVTPPRPRRAPVAVPVPPVSSKRSRTDYQRREVLRREVIERIVSTVEGYRLGLADATSIDDTITSGEATRWASSLTDGIVSLSRFRKLLRKHNT
jgi:hypothetical protein